jgi:hypothetical protein
MYLVNCTRGGTLTFTENPHVAVRLWASVAVQVTLVLPGANDDPDGGAQATVTGVDPPVAVGLV